MKTIAIVGGGCAGTLLFRYFSEDLPPEAPVTVLIFEPEELGAGLPYGSEYQDDAFILNMQARTLSASRADTREFCNWMKKTHPEFRERDYCQRKYMGEYLREVVLESQARFQQKHIHYDVVKTSVTDLVESGEEYNILTSGRAYQAHVVILALGHLPKKPMFSNVQSYYSDLYRSLGEIAHIPLGKKIGILGTKLTAIDAAIFLGTRGQTNLYMMSSSGRIPKVQGKKNKPIEDYEEDTKPPKTIGNFLRRMKEKVKKYWNPEKQGFISSELKCEMKTAKKRRPWQYIFDKTKVFIDEFWHSLSPFMKSLFLKKYQGIWTSVRHPMPYKNARKIMNLIQKKSLTVLKILSRPLYCEENHQFVIEAQAKNGIQSIELDYLIDATGTPAEIKKLDSTLIENLLHKHYMKPCQFGGAELDFDTLRLKDKRSIYVIGTLTKGEYFYVNAIEQIVKQAAKITKTIVKGL